MECVVKSKSRRWTAIAGLATVSACGHGSAPSSAPTPAGAPISAADLHKRLFIYADDSMQGRETGTIGNVRATNYIAAQVKQLGLTPAGSDGTYFVTVPLIVREPDTTGTLAVDGTTLKRGTDYVVMSPVPAFLPFGTKLDAATGIDVVYGGRLGDPTVALSPDQIAGKVIVVDPPLGIDGHPDWRFWQHGGIERFSGAAALVIGSLDVSPPMVVDYFAQPQMSLDDGKETTPSGPLGILVTGRVAAKMLGISPDGAKPTPGAAGRPVTGSLRWIVGPSAAPARDVVAILPGSDPALRGEYVAIGAHNDHLGFNHRPLDLDSLHAFNTVAWNIRGRTPDGAPATPTQLAAIHVNVDSLRAVHAVRRDSVFKGADDDGSGTVSVLEIAQAMVAAPVKPKRSILFVWHTGEEKGLFGSEYFTDHPTVTRDSIVAQLNMDMVGRGDSADIKGGGPTYVELVGSRRLSTELGDLVESVNKTEPVPMTFDYTFDANGHPENIYCRSDHYEYARYGIPIVFFTTGLHQDYHQLTDEPQYIDYEHMARVDHLVFDVALAVANLDHRPVVDHQVPDPKAPCKQ
jgi:hypothetical protein